MKRQDDQNDPSASPATGQPEDGSVPLAPFAPPVSDPGVLALLKGLNPPENPVPLETSSTDGELSASFAAGPRAAPKAHAGGEPDASVVVAPPPAKKKKPPSPDQLNTTFRLRPSQPSVLIPALLAALVGGGAAGIWVWLHRSDDARPALTVSPLTPVRPSGSPAMARPVATPFPIPSDIPPVPPAAPAVPADSAQAVPVPSASAAPAVPSASKPPKSAPRRKEDEPDRTL